MMLNFILLLLYVDICKIYILYKFNFDYIYDQYLGINIMYFYLWVCKMYV